ncbi:MAG: hypothetical protein KQA41_03715 [Candidatus Aenigmarchaeota archaeon]|nr:hypothetical protein [Candidatus Aenigmarchaeota archaeon]
MTKNSIAFLLSFFLIALIILTTPTKSLEVLIKGLSGTYIKGSTITFTIEANISSGEQIPVNFIILNISGSSNYNCKIYMNNTVEGCPFLNVNSIEYDSFGYGYGYGYENGYHYLGYGYGYGPNKIKINLTIDTTSLNGSYNAKAEIHAGINPDLFVFSSPLYSFTIQEKMSTQTIGSPSSALRYFMEILNVEGKEGKYSVKVKNSGTEKLKVHLIIELPEENQTLQPIIINPKEEALLNYTIKEGLYKYRVIVVGESNGIKLTRYIDMNSTQEFKETKNQTSTNEEIIEQTNSQQQDKKSPTTGLAIAAIDVINKYKLIIVLLAVFSISIILLKRLR